MSRTRKSSYLWWKYGKTTGCTLGGQHPVEETKGTRCTLCCYQSINGNQDLPRGPHGQDSGLCIQRTTLWSINIIPGCYRNIWLPPAPIGIKMKLVGCSLHSYLGWSDRVESGRLSLTWCLVKLGKAGATGLLNCSDYHFVFSFTT